MLLSGSSFILCCYDCLGFQRGSLTSLGVHKGRTYASLVKITMPGIILIKFLYLFWTSYFTSVDFSFLICNMEVIILPYLGGFVIITHS